MRILFAIAHYYNPQGGGRYGSLGPNSQGRINALSSSIISLHQLFNRQYMLDIARRQTIPANQLNEYAIDVIISTTGNSHLLSNLPISANIYSHNATSAEPMMLGFECQAILKNNLGKYDYYCYLEDDLILHDPHIFTKLGWFNNNVGNSCLLQPNRYETSPEGPVYKSYIDGDINPRATAGFQNVNEQPEISGSIMGKPVLFKRALNPHSGCYFLNAEQMDIWSKESHFQDRDTGFIGPLESAATLGVMRTFKVYKPAPVNANFFEIQHYGRSFLSQIGKQIAFIDQ